MFVFRCRLLFVGCCLLAGVCCVVFVFSIMYCVVRCMVSVVCTLCVV